MRWRRHVHVHERLIGGRVDIARHGMHRRIADRQPSLQSLWSPIALNETSTELMDAKGVMRRRAYDARNAQGDKDGVSELAVAALVRLPEYQEAQTVLWYLDCRSELRTRHALPMALASGKRIAVPYCTV